jgi:phage-related protein
VTTNVKPVVWLGDLLRTVRAFPATVKDEIGYALFLAQRGHTHEFVKPLKGLGSDVFEIASDDRSGTYRAVLTVRLAGRLCVLHAFQKKSRKGIATP